MVLVNLYDGFSFARDAGDLDLGRDPGYTRVLVPREALPREAVFETAGNCFSFARDAGDLDLGRDPGYTRVLVPREALPREAVFETAGICFFRGTSFLNIFALGIWDVPKTDFSYSMSSFMNPLLGHTTLLFLYVCSKDFLNVHLLCFIRKLRTTVVDLDIPADR